MTGLKIAMHTPLLVGFDPEDKSISGILARSSFKVHEDTHSFGEMNN
jgi:hypothetical protein